jgi:integrase
VTKRLAEEWLRDVLDGARRAELPGMVRTGATVADAAAEWPRHVEHDRACKPSRLTDYRHTAERIVRALGTERLEDVRPEQLKRWKATLTASNRTVAKYLVILHGIFRRAMKVWGLPRNPAASVERPRFRVSDDLDAFTPEEVWALVRAADSEQDACMFLTAAFTGLRMGELLALQWRDVDYTGDVIRVRRSYNVHGGVGSPKSGKVRAVPMVSDVAACAAPRCRRSRRGWGTPTFRRRCATSITVIAAARRGCWRRRFDPLRPARSRRARTLRDARRDVLRSVPISSRLSSFQFRSGLPGRGWRPAACAGWGGEHSECAECVSVRDVRDGSVLRRSGRGVAGR